MNVLIVTDQAYLPDRVGGRESSIHEMAELYQRQGHAVVVLVDAAPPPWGRAWLEMPAFLARRATWRAPYRIVRLHGVRALLWTFVGALRPDITFVNFNNVESIFGPDQRQRAGVCVVCLRDLQAVECATPASFPGDVVLVANSEYTARRYTGRTGTRPRVVPPLITPGRFACRTSGEYVTFVNPVRHKGVDIAIEVARALPEIPFLFVEGWPVPRRYWTELRRRVAPLGNVRLKRRVLDMRRIYSRTGLLLVPSTWEEGFGRVVVEAQMSGVPAVASDRGGLPEAVGDGGILLSADAEISAWADAVQRIWADRCHFLDLATRARDMANRHHANALRETMRLLSLAVQH